MERYFQLFIRNWINIFTCSSTDRLLGILNLLRWSLRGDCAKTEQLKEQIKKQKTKKPKTRHSKDENEDSRKGRERRAFCCQHLLSESTGDVVTMFQEVWLVFWRDAEKKNSRCLSPVGHGIQFSWRGKKKNFTWRRGGFLSMFPCSYKCDISLKIVGWDLTRLTRQSAITTQTVQWRVKGTVCKLLRTRGGLRNRNNQRPITKWLNIRKQRWQEQEITNRSGGKFKLTKLKYGREKERREKAS